MKVNLTKCQFTKDQTRRELKKKKAHKIHKPQKRSPSPTVKMRTEYPRESPAFPQSLPSQLQLERLSEIDNWHHPAQAFLQFSCKV